MHLCRGRKRGGRWTALRINENDSRTGGYRFMLTFLIFRCISYYLIYSEPSVEYKENKGTRCGIRVLMVKFSECN